MQHPGHRFCIKSQNKGVPFQLRQKPILPSGRNGKKSDPVLNRTMTSNRFDTSRFLHGMGNTNFDPKPEKP
jgi:hypothetical protein